jgi:hypothetical protein
MADPKIPQFRFVAVSDAVPVLPAGTGYADFAPQRMGSVYMINRGANPCYVAFDVASGTLANTNGDGRFLLPVGRALTLDDIVFTRIGFRCTLALTTLVDVIALPRPGNLGLE